VFHSQDNIVSFPLETWHPLTEPPTPRPVATATVAKTAAPREPMPSVETQPVTLGHPTGLNPDLTKVLLDTLVYPYDGIRVRIQRLNMSVRAFEKAKLEGCEKGLILESAAGRTVHVVPLPKTFEAFGFPCPYKRDVSTEHSFYEGWGQYLLQQDPANKKVHTEWRLGTSGSTADIVTVGHDGLHRAYEVTLSVGNCLSNAAKYTHTDFVQIIFLCRDHKAREAAKACCREGGLDPRLWMKLDFMQFSALVRRQEERSS